MCSVSELFIAQGSPLHLPKGIMLIGRNALLSYLLCCGVQEASGRWERLQSKTVRMTDAGSY